MQENNNYRISASTMALVTAKHPYYRSIIFDEEGTYLSLQTIVSMFLDLGIKEYEMSRGKDKYRNNEAQVSYIMNTEQNIYAFSTKMKTETNCMWIFPEHVEEIGEQTFPRLTFKNGERLKINCTKEQYMQGEKDLQFLK
ncbi:competence protein ComK [Bacillus sp. JJ722]|uniref:competence protein ComK n=1 Tax=Bacillus sp. JJ722 TaxID=3122973 RepID=UPI003000DE2B